MPEELEAPGLGFGPDEADPGADETSDSAPADLLSPDEDESPKPAPSPTPSDDDAGPAPAFDLSTVDFRRDKPEDWPEEHRGWLTKQQEQFKAVQGNRGREIADQRRREEALNAREQAIIDRERAGSAAQRAPAAQGADAADSQAEQIAELLKNPDLDKDTRSALMLMVRSIEEAKAYTDAQLAQYQPLLKTVPEVERVVGSMTAADKARQRHALMAEVDEAIAAYSGADIDNNSEFIMRTLGLERRGNDYERVVPALINPATGVAHTVKSAYELVAGITGEAARMARDEDRRIRNKAKDEAAELPTVGSPSDGPLSEEQTRARVREIMGIA